MAEADGNGLRRGEKVEDTALSRISEQQSAAIAGAAAKEQHEIQSAILIAKRMPRNEQEAFGRLMKAAARPSFAEDASYRFPRGVKENGEKNYVEGPSVNVAREAGRVWGNMRYGLYVVEDTEETRKIRGWAWDLESNVKVEADDEFGKLIQRKQKGGAGTAWVKPDERDLRELTNRRGAILMRNCLLQILPKDLVEDALDRCRQTLETRSKEDPEGARKRVIAVFAEANVTVGMLEERLGKPLSQCTPTELTDLRKVGVSIRDGQMSWAEYAADSQAQARKEAQEGKLANVQAALKAKREGKTSPEEAAAPPPATSEPEPETDATWLSSVLDLEDAIRQETGGAAALRIYRTSLGLEGNAYPQPAQQAAYLARLRTLLAELRGGAAGQTEAAAGTAEASPGRADDEPMPDVEDDEVWGREVGAMERQHPAAFKKTKKSFGVERAGYLREPDQRRQFVLTFRDEVARAKRGKA